jgi:hypothetical protein
MYYLKETKRYPAKATKKTICVICWKQKKSAMGRKDIKNNALKTLCHH